MSVGQQWYYRQNGQQHGPISGSELKQLAAAGKLNAADTVKKDGMADWLPASQVKGLFPDIHDKVRARADAVGRTAGTVSKVAKAAGTVSDAVSDVAEAGGKVQKAATTVAGIAAGGSTLAGSVGDFLRPLGPINLVIFAAALLSGGVLYVVAVRKPKVKVKVRLKMGAVASLAAAVVFGLWSGLGAVAGKDDKGFLATNVKPVGQLQASVMATREPASTDQQPIPASTQEKRIKMIRLYFPDGVHHHTIVYKENEAFVKRGDGSLAPLQITPSRLKWGITPEFGGGTVEVDLVSMKLLPGGEKAEIDYEPVPDAARGVTPPSQPPAPVETLPKGWAALSDTEEQVQKHWRQGDTRGSFFYDAPSKTIKIKSLGYLGEFRYQGSWLEFQVVVNAAQLSTYFDKARRNFYLRINGVTTLKLDPAVIEGKGPVRIAVKYDPKEHTIVGLVDGKVVDQTTVTGPGWEKEMRFGIETANSSGESIISLYDARVLTADSKAN